MTTPTYAKVEDLYNVAYVSWHRAMEMHIGRPPGWTEDLRYANDLANAVRKTEKAAGDLACMLEIFRREISSMHMKRY